jgi:hypothetical protein
MDLPECLKCGVKQKRETAKFCYKCGHQEFRHPGPAAAEPTPTPTDLALDYSSLIEDTISEIASGIHSPNHSPKTSDGRAPPFPGRTSGPGDTG